VNCEKCATQIKQRNHRYKEWKRIEDLRVSTSSHLMNNWYQPYSIASNMTKLGRITSEYKKPLQMRWCYKESNTLCRQLELATGLLSSPSLMITKFETLQNNNIYTQKQVFCLHKVGLNLGSTDISDWRCVVLDADTWCMGVQHGYMWRHSIPFIFLNYYRCLCGIDSIVFCFSKK
jgi:hypothetical protein